MRQDQRDALEKALDETGADLHIEPDPAPLEAVDSSLRTHLLAAGWICLVQAAAVCVPLGFTFRESAPFMVVLIGAAFAGMVFLQRRKPSQRFLLYQDRVVRLNGSRVIEVPLAEVVVTSRKGATGPLYSFEPKELNLPGLFSQEGYLAPRTYRLLTALKRLGVQLEAREWKRNPDLDETPAFIKSAGQAINLAVLLFGSLIGLAGILALVVLVRSQLLEGAGFLLLLGGFSALCFWLIRKVDDRRAQKPSGVVFQPERIIWLRKGEEVWAVQKEDVRRFEVCWKSSYLVFTLVTLYGRRMSLEGIERNQLLQQINGRGFELVWTDEKPSERGFLP